MFKSSLTSIGVQKSTLSMISLLLGWTIANGIIWGSALTYIKSQKPIYISKWSLVLPGENKTSVDLPQIGQTSLNSDQSVFLRNLDPRNNLVYLASSEPVLEAAAKSINLPIEEFGEPQIDLIKDASVIEFSIEAESPNKAQTKAMALHLAVMQRIESLKQDRILQESERIQESLREDKDRLQQAQKVLENHKASAALVTPEQIPLLADKLEQLRQQKNEIQVELKEVTTTINTLSTNLKLSPQEANKALILVDDPLFQGYVQEYSAAEVNLSNLSSVYTDNSPNVAQERAKKQAVEEALLERGRHVLGEPLTMSALEKVVIDSGNTGNREVVSIIQDLVTLQGKQQSLIVKDQQLSEQVQALDSRLKTIAKDQIPLENIQREIKFAEALLTSKVAQKQLNDAATPAFPVVQLLIAPSLPVESSGPSEKFPLLAALGGSILLTTGLLLFKSDGKKA